MLDELFAWRDRLLGRPAVRDALGRWPGGRQVAARHAARLFGIVAGFAHSQMLAAAVELGLFERLAAGPLPRAALADALALPPAGAAALVDAAEALGLIEARPHGRVGLTIDGLVVASDPGLRAMIAHHRLLYRDLADPVALLAAPGSGAVGAFWPYAGNGGGDAAGYSRLMAATQAMVQGAAIGAHDFGRHGALLDVGGGDGGFAIALARRWPALRLGVADLPAVADAARARLDREGLARIATHPLAPGDPLPGGYAAISLVRVLHDRDDPAALALLRAAGAALPPGGTLVIAEPMARRGRDPQAAYFTAYFAAMGSGRLRRADEIAGLCRQAGLRVRRRRPQLAPTVGLLVATRA